MQPHSVIDLEADENAQVIKAYNSSALSLIIEDMCLRDGIEETEANVLHLLENAKAGVN